MAAGNSSDVTIFLVLFLKLKDWVENNPSLIETTASEDDGFKALCTKIYWAGRSLEREEKKERQLFANPVDAKFASQWREYKEAYEERIHSFLFRDVDKLLFGDEPRVKSESQNSKSESEWENANETANERVEAIRSFLSLAKEYIIDGDREFPEEFCDELQVGFEAILDLRHKAGIDFRGIFRRRELVPFVLIPRHVSPAYNDGKKELLTDYLQQAQEAFVKGVPRASIALLRSTVEAVLIWYYRSSGSDLNQLIGNAKLLPPGANKAALHRLREFANEILHIDQKDGSRVADLKLLPLNDAKQELELASLLRIARDLIEAAPDDNRNQKRKY